MSTTSEPRNIQRRTIVKGAAWSVPVIVAAVAAPAQAASTLCSGGGSVNFDAIATPTYPPAYPQVLTFGDSGVTAALSYSKSSPDMDDAPTGAVLNVPPAGLVLQINGHDVGTDGSTLGFIHEGDWVTATFTFSAPVKDLSMSIRDINNMPVDDPNRAGGWWDEVYFDQPLVVTSLGDLVVGSGTSADPLQSKAWATSYPHNPTDPIEGAVVRFPGPLQSLTLTYRAGATSNGRSTEYILINELSFASC